MNAHAKLRSFFKKAQSHYRLTVVAFFYLILVVSLGLSLNTADTLETSIQQNPLAIRQQGIVDDELNQMLKWSLFGQAKENIQKISDSNIQLIGIIFEGNKSQAIIRIDGVEQLLKIGSKINNNYTINKIEPLRVIVSTTNGLQQLELFDSSQGLGKQYERSP